jgi:FKBP-type peptidyl-prolyl cis-trans isomerase
MKTLYEYKNVLAGIGCALLLTSLAGCDRGADPDMNTGNAGASPGYNAGYDLGVKLALLRQQQPDIELDDAFKGMLDALSDTRQITSRTEFCARLQSIENRPDKVELQPAEIEFKRTERIQPPQTEAPSHNIFKADYTKDDFAALNAKREGVVTLPSGVQYEVMKAGSGEPPRPDDAVVISYQASFADGTAIDTTDDSESLYIPLDDIVVPGLKEALLLMNTGARWKVVVPPSMGFTKSGNRTLRRRDLIYDIMLVSIDRAQP